MNPAPANAPRYSFHSSCAFPCISRSRANPVEHPCQELYHLLFENNPSAMWVFDEASLKFLEVNHAACLLYGYSREEFLAMTVSDIHPPGEIFEIIDAAELPEVPARPAGVWCHLKKDGSPIFAQISASATQMDGRRAALAVIHEVTELKQTERALHEAQKELEARVKERTAELKKANTELRKEMKDKQLLERKLLEVSESEQRKLGQDLHDDLGQQLTGMGLLASVLAGDLRKQGNSHAEEAQNLVKYMGEASLCARNLAKGLYPMALDRDGFVVALEQLASRISKASNVRCAVKCAPAFMLLDGSAIQIYRIIQEAVNNAIKHGSAHFIEIECKMVRNAPTIIIRNDGIPFREPARKAKGMGLNLMRHRARMIGARLIIRRGRQGGCEMICSVLKHRKRRS